MTNLFENNGAEFSPCRKYRYALWRIWDESKPLVMFIGLNPSTANEVKTDPTITRVRAFAERWGCGGFYMMNLFALVSPYPKDLARSDDPVGDNDGWLERIAPKCARIIFAWGNFHETKMREDKIIAMFPHAEALIINQNGSPRHPLYVPGDVEPVKFIG
jgi:hypothetical protein